MLSSDPSEWTCGLEGAPEIEAYCAQATSRVRSHNERLEKERRALAHARAAYEKALADSILSGDKTPSKPASLKELEKEVATLESIAPTLEARATEVRSQAATYLHRLLAEELRNLRVRQVGEAAEAYRELKAAALKLAAALSKGEAQAVFSPAGADRVPLHDLPDGCGITPRIRNIESVLGENGSPEFKLNRLVLAANAAAEAKAEAPAVAGAEKE